MLKWFTTKLICLGLGVMACGALAFADPGYHVMKRLKLGGEGGWDYLTVDSDARRLYVSRGSHVLVVDIETDKVVGDIPETPGVHGVALAPEFNRGFTSNGREDTSTIFDLKSLKAIGKVNTGKNPDAIVYDPPSKNIFAFNGGSNDVTVIDAASGKIAGAVVLDGKPEFAVADGEGKIDVNIQDKNEVMELDTRNLKVINRFALKIGEKPTGMAMDPAHHRIFSGCRNQIMTVLDTQTGNVMATVPIGAGVDGNGFDASSGLVFSANGWDGTLTVARESSPGKFEVVETVPTQRGARTMAIDAKTHDIYLPTAQMVPVPEPTPGEPRKRPQIIKDTFEILVVGNR